MNNEITILQLHTRHGADLLAFEDPFLADRVIDAFVVKNWPNHFPDIPIPRDIDEAVHYYFKHRVTDDFTIETIPITRGLNEIDFLKEGS